jgi:hypothetical protein
VHEWEGELSFVEVFAEAFLRGVLWEPVSDVGWEEMKVAAERFWDGEGSGEGGSLASAEERFW